MTTRKFILSCETFNGYTVDVCIDNIKYNLEEVVDIVIVRLYGILSKYSLNMLIPILENKKYHIHTHSWDDVLKLDSVTPIYICSC
jgi:hypothetical protein